MKESQISESWKREEKPFDRMEAECAAGAYRAFYLAELRQAPGVRRSHRETDLIGSLSTNPSIPLPSSFSQPEVAGHFIP